MANRGEYPIVVLMTAGNQENAQAIAHALVEERLAACVNIIREMRSIYRWQGEIEDEAECLMIAKTRSSAFASLEKRVRELHSYEVPEIIALRIDRGSNPYLGWIFDSSGVSVRDGREDRAKPAHSRRQKKLRTARVPAAATRRPR
jgi:periplasmic divalent cation tolerance protein